MQFDKITADLYVGPRPDGEGWRQLKQAGITANLNLQAEERDGQFGSYAPQASLWLPTGDWQGPDEKTIVLGAAYIQMMVAAGHKVYVHCKLGMGRAPTLGVGYLVTTGMDVEDALKLMKQQRPSFKPNTMQVNAVRSFAKNWSKNNHS